MDTSAFFATSRSVDTLPFPFFIVKTAPFSAAPPVHILLFHKISEFAFSVKQKETFSIHFSISIGMTLYLVQIITFLLGILTDYATIFLYKMELL